MKNLLSILIIVFGLFFSQSVMAEDLHFNLNNDASVSVVEFYTSPANVGRWGANLMKGYELPPDGEVEVAIVDGVGIREYDILVIFSDGSKSDDRSVNLCDLGSYTVTD